MTKNQNKNLPLQELLNRSRAVRFLLKSYQQALRDLAAGTDQNLQKTLSVILKREKPADLQNVYFLESVLQNFVETHLPLPAEEELLEEYRDQACQLVQNFLFFGEKEKQEILPYIGSLGLEDVKKLIELYQLGHHKQDQYLQTFAEKDPKLALKFQLLVSSGSPQNQMKK
jgi:hypothetical protein